jgi:hypothetical protein
MGCVCTAPADNMISTRAPGTNLVHFIANLPVRSLPPAERPEAISPVSRCDLQEDVSPIRGIAL